MAQLNTYPTMVEAPFVMVTIAGYTFGNISKSGSLPGKLIVDFPNFIKDISVKKTDGEINQYTINLVYAVRPGDDPNFVDKIFSDVGYGNITVSYGDFSYPSIIYKDEEAIITNLSQKFNFQSSCITYTISATGTPFKLRSSKYNFPAMKNVQPSSVVKSIITNSKYGIGSVFTGMYSMNTINENGWIPSNDMPVDLQAQIQTDCWSYLTYLTDSMESSDSKTSIYKLAVNSDNKNKSGTYFEIKEMSKQGSTNQADAFDIDIGFPGSNYVSSFDITTDQGWSILMEGAADSKEDQYSYTLNDEGNIVTMRSPALTRSTTYYKPTAQATNWWNDMVNFPITATLTLKGLVAPTLLLSYININVVFYGVKHNTSGMYFITEQVDNISNNGYKTTFKLQRVPVEE